MDPKKSDPVGRRTYIFGHSSPRVQYPKKVGLDSSEMEEREEDGLTGLVSCLENNTAPASLEVNFSCKYHVSKKDARLVQDALAHNTTVTDLSLVYEPYSYADKRACYFPGESFSQRDTADANDRASAIFKGLQKNTSLTRLKSTNVRFGDVAGKLLADVLKSEGCSLREIELHQGVMDQTMSVETIGAFATTLPCSTTLETLKLEGCSWRQTAFARFCELSKTLSLSPSLTALDIRTVQRPCFVAGETECGLEMVLIADGLCTNTRLRALSLDCPITRRGGVHPGVGHAFANLIQLNTTLTKLKLYDIQQFIFSSAGIDAITNSLVVSKTIQGQCAVLPGYETLNLTRRISGKRTLSRSHWGDSRAKSRKQMIIDAFRMCCILLFAMQISTFWFLVDPFSGHRRWPVFSEQVRMRLRRICERNCERSILIIGGRSRNRTGSLWGDTRLCGGTNSLHSPWG